jgi:Predicted transcriptional regulators
MSMEAVGIYFLELRQAQGLSQQDVADEVGVSDRIVSAWEKGKHVPKIDVMPKLLQRLRGSWDDVKRLMLEDANDTMAREMAKQRLKGAGLTDEQRAFLESLNPDQREALLAFARQMIQRR